MPELLRFLIIAILILYIVRKLASMLLPMLFQSVINKAQQPNPGPRQHNYNSTNAKKPEAGVKIDHIPAGKKGTVPDSEGDFIDYEEIK